MRSKISDLCEILGLVLIAVAVAALAGAWWGILVGGVALVIYGLALDDAPEMPGGGG